MASLLNCNISRRIDSPNFSQSIFSKHFQFPSPKDVHRDFDFPNNRCGSAENREDKKETTMYKVQKTKKSRRQKRKEKKEEGMSTLFDRV